MLEMKLYNNILTIKYDKKVIPDETTFFCERQNVYCYNYNVQYDLATIKIGSSLKKNFEIINLEKNYIIYNEKNQVIIDTNIFSLLNHFNLEEINQELLEILCKLGFIISE